jgi:hypothetical protein
MRIVERLTALPNRVIAWMDALQRRHGALGFPYAVIKKFGDDDGGREAVARCALLAVDGCGAR